MMQRHDANGLGWYTFPGLDDTFHHALLTRQGGVSEGAFASLNLGSTVGDAPAAVAENHRRLCATFDLTREQVVSPHQVHGRHVAVVERSDGGSIIPETDALITDQPGVVLLMRFADCTPVLFYDSVHRAVGLAHAGWRGTAVNVVAATVEAMQAAFGTQPADLWAGIGPAIGPAHYRVGEDVVQAIAATLPPQTPIATRHDGQWHLDLPGAVAAQLAAAGVGQIARSGLDTAGDPACWYSHRGEAGHTGRFGVWVMI